ncbi:glycerophosphodiester phosphodiesterase [Frankia sp. CNm7]|uniref:Glycerophosphodiester phosphodiesterase n=1 Tax=Frankia nepalensis TaxID=1836974 RepID=A0A937RJ37_9ACTN|nr:glycerophosphodiester phosphodiesterase [Frankia nepalensis]MBL7500730.1 glycerophosphodiester phosphodiesterase [Frankia nepalensis]MBL7513204.1 glycerophosphodiester phosphodiesterase [Frankia nepalensis]MBL7518695.1 glycerophosphodiester phosphodiesterase [Frankia nepalensis]MBL7633198.1 glycerophosphodiester phosphodiesterase [Frankia nepalensis]
MEVLGHRGSRNPGPENTPLAVEAALAAGADGIEVDIRRTADGDLVCLHDPRLPRLGGRAVVRRSTAELVAKGVPLLHDVLDAWGGRGRIIIEIKNQPGQPDFDAPREERAAQLLVELLRARGLTGPEAGVTVSSFDWFAIERVRAADVGVRTAFLTMPRMAVTGGLAYVRSAGHAELHAHTSAVLAATDAAARARAAGIRLVTWTVTSERAALRLREAGVDAIICDAPADIVRALKAPA